jgi:hypothetical protein
MTPLHGNSPATLYSKTYTTAFGSFLLPSPSGDAIERGAGLARAAGVDPQQDRGGESEEEEGRK